MTLLIQKPIASGEIVTIKLVSGEELIAKMENNDSTGVTLSRPLTLTFGQNGIGMTSWMVTADPEQKVVIKHDKITTIVPTFKDAAERYSQGTHGIRPVTPL